MNRRDAMSAEKKTKVPNPSPFIERCSGARGWPLSASIAPLRLNWGPWSFLWVWVLILPALFGCRSVPQLAPANLKEPGWTVRTGQAVWRLPQGQREIAGEVLVATRDHGQSFVQFSKSPFTLVVAQATPQGWQVEFPPQNKHYAGRGAPPTRLLWLYLPRVLSGQPPPRHWIWHWDASGWRLENPATGESLEGYFSNGG
jgi:hypothetical protein